MSRGGHARRRGAGAAPGSVKIRVVPEDFRVVESIDLAPGVEGRHAVYRLTKRDLGTLEAVREAARALGVDPARFAVAGLKDRHADTVQVVTCDGGPARGAEGEGFRLEYLGRGEQEAAPSLLRGNRFEITVRGLRREAALAAAREIPRVQADGVPNWFDRQRFGSARGAGGDFIGRHLVRGDPEGALRLAIATPAREDRGTLRRTREAIRASWGRWEEALRGIREGGPEAAVVRWLAEHPGDFSGAFSRFERPQRLLYLEAYQSHLWNRTLERVLRALVPRSARVEIPGPEGPLLFPRGTPPEALARLRDLAIPYIHPGVASDDPIVRDAIAAVLAAEDLPAERFDLPDLGVSFPRGARSALFLPEDISLSGPAPDDRSLGLSRVKLRCFLPPGAYATIVVKRLFHGAASG